MVNYSNIKYVLCDVEGTLTAISFVKETLFPYSTTHLEDFLEINGSKQHVQKTLTDLINLPEAKEENLKIGDKSKINDFIRHLIKTDSKVGPLKLLQGLIWEQGFRDGSIKGHIFSEVPDALKKWKDMGLEIYIYSSGSVAAQQLLFANSEYGDLLPLISGHFDTKVGHKQQKQSYEKIITELKCHPKNVIFLTDIYNEAKAAIESGMYAVLLDRPGNYPLTDSERMEFDVVKSLDEIELNAKE